MYAKSIILSCFICFVCCPSLSYAERDAYVIKTLDFGQVTSSRSDAINIVIDARTTEKPVCDPVTDCVVSGGSIGVIEFYGYENKVITMHYPSEVILKNEGKEIGRIYRMNVYSDAKAQKIGSVQRANLGGVLRISAQNIGESLSSPVMVEFSVN